MMRVVELAARATYIEMFMYASLAISTNFSNDRGKKCENGTVVIVVVVIVGEMFRRNIE